MSKYRRRIMDELLQRRLESKGAIVIEVPKDLIKDLNTLGLLFETMAVRDLRVYAQHLQWQDISLS